MANTQLTNEQVIAESTKVAQEAARVAGTTFTPGATITGEGLTPTAAPVINQPEEAPITNVQNLPVDEPQKQPDQTPSIGLADDISKQIDDFDTESKITSATQEQTRELEEITKQIRLNQAAATEAEDKALQSGETIGFARGEAAAVRREFRVEAMRLSAEAQALQGNLTLATKLARDSVKEEFKQLENDLDAQAQNIRDNFDSFSAKDKNRALETLSRIERQKEFVKEQKDQKNKLDDMLLGAAFEQVPNSVRAEARQKFEETGSLEDAASILAPFLAKEEKLVSPKPATIPGTNTKVAGTIGGVDVSNATLNAFKGLAPKTPTEKSQLQTGIRNLGLTDEEPPQWFIDAAQEERDELENLARAGIVGPIRPEELERRIIAEIKKKWDKERNVILKMVGGKSTDSPTPTVRNPRGGTPSGG